MKIRLINQGILFLVVISALHFSSKIQANEKEDWKMGVQFWTFHKFTFRESVEKTKQLGLKYIEVYFGQKLGDGFEGNMDFNMDKITQQKIQDLLKLKGIEIIACGVVKCKNEADWIQLFEFAKTMGIKIITSEPDSLSLDLVEKLADQYKIDVAIHNHPKPSAYWNPEVLMKVLEGRSQRLGACADVGHWKRMGIDPVAALKILNGRVKSLHLKDVKEGIPESHDVIWGHGVCNIPGILSEFKKQNFKGLFSIEYEYNWDNSIPDITKCIGYYDEQLEILFKNNF